MARTDYGAILSTVIKDTSDAIREIKGSSGLIAPADWGTEIRSISGGAEPKDVNYFDCFGNVLYAYTAAEYANLTAHPAGSNIESKGVPLTFDSWNYTFSNAQTYVSKYGKLNIGGTYHPTDNKTHFFLDIKSAAYSNIDIRFKATTTATVDWGDGTTETVSGAFISKHNYNDSGVFEITIDGTITISGNLLPDRTQSKYLTDIFLYTTNVGSDSFQYCSSLKSITILEGITVIPVSCFVGCSSLEYVTIPSGVTSINLTSFVYCSSLTIVTLPDTITSISGDAFMYNSSLKSMTIPEGITVMFSFLNNSALTSVVIPEGVTNINTFQYCFSLKSIIIPDGVTSISNNAFQFCEKLKSITIPDGVANIGNGAFRYCSNMVYADFSAATAIPTLGNSTVFDSMPSLSAIIVPDALYDDWIVATRWSDYASMIVKASEYTKPF